MNEKLLEIYEKCKEHNISISIKYLLSDAVIEVEGVTLAYDSKNRKYEKLKCDKWVSIQQMRVVNNIDLVVSAINEIFIALNNRKDQLGK